MIAILRELYAIVRPSGGVRLAGVLSIGLLQALVQSFAVLSFFPFLGIIADPDRFRASPTGRLFVQAIGDGSDHRVAVWVGMISLLLLVCGNLAGLAADYVRNRYCQFIAHRVRQELVEKLLFRRYEYFAGINTSMLIKHLVADVGVTTQALLAPALDILARGFLVLLLVGALLWLEPLIVLGGGALVVLYYLFVMCPIRSRAARTSDQMKQGFRALHFELQQLLSGIKPILASGRSSYFAARVEQVSRHLTGEVALLPSYAAIPRASLEILVFGALIAWVISALAAGAALESLIPRVGLLAIVAYRLMPSMQAIFSNFASMTANRQSLDELSGLSRQQKAFAGVGAQSSANCSIEPLQWSREIRFENVCFRYAGAPEHAINDVSLTIAKGMRTAIVGTTGSGKTTLVDMLLGLYCPTGGRILVDGIALSPDKIPAWRRTVGYAAQDVFLLDGSVAENIAFGSELDPARLSEAANLAQLVEFFDTDERDFETRVGERGVRLSGGQRQRIALARALYGRPTLLVLDEATSALDPRTEQRLLAGIAITGDELTLVTVTHRLNTVKHYDCIHYVENGRLVASGDFESLVASQRRFREFVA